MSAEHQRHYFTLGEVSRLAKESALEHGQHVATLIVEGDKESVIGPILDLPGTFDARREMMFAIGETLAKEDRLGSLKQVFFITEGWMSIARRDPKIQVLPSKDPARKEVLLIDCLNVESRHNHLVVFEMIRDNQGQLADLQDVDTPDDRGDLTAQSPLLTAFMEGFQSAK